MIVPFKRLELLLRFLMAVCVSKGKRMLEQSADGEHSMLDRWIGVAELREDNGPEVSVESCTIESWRGAGEKVVESTKLVG